MKNFKSYNTALALVASLALSGCGGGGSSSDNPTAPPENSTVYTTNGTDRATIDYINPNNNSFSITWHKDSTGLSGLEMTSPDFDTGADRRMFTISGTKPGTGIMECTPSSSSSERIDFTCEGYWWEEGGERVDFTDNLFYLDAGGYMDIHAEYYDEPTETYYNGETFGTLEWDGTQLIVN